MIGATKEDSGTQYAIVLDDDKVICKLIEEIIGIKSFSFASVSEFLVKKNGFNPVGVFVDVHLANDECGLDIIPDIRKKWPMVPIIVMTADDDESIIAKALSLGANDFIVKPLRPTEVKSRLSTRRKELLARSNIQTITYGDLTLDLQHRTLTGPKGQSHPSSREIQILAMLMNNSGTVLDKESIKCHAWGKVAISSNAVDRKLFEVRKAIKDVSDEIELKSVYGVGVVLRKVTFEEDQLLLIDKEVQLSL